MRIKAILFLLSFLMPCIAFCEPGTRVKMRKVHLKLACGFVKNVKLNYLCFPNPRPQLSDIVSAMIHFNGNSSDGIRIEDSDYATMPITGLDSAGNIVIIVDSRQILAKSHWYMISILAHELGHITNRDVYLNDCVSRPHELKADYYAGFWAHRAQCPSVDSVIAPFLTVIPDQDHPDGAKRREWVKKGWQAEEEPFEPSPKKSITLPTLKDTYGQYIDLYATITPYQWNIASKHYDVFKTKLLIGTNDLRLPVSRVVSLIEKVTYSADDKLFRLPFAEFSNKNNNFSYMTFGRQKQFPVTCTIYFIDHSTMTITKDFQFK
jgi:hypothetical protein